ncbi:MAG: DUF1080 domain-containing protein [Phycisphaerales bacterium]|nr:MAG: DUF1080 domain-containing protein [Phycisphaerales bacterium]
MRNGQMLVVVAVSFCVAGCPAERGPIRISDDLRLAEMESFSADPQVAMQDAWRMEDGVLVCSGRPLGYLYTKTDIRDFTLKLEWRWPDDKKPGKGGVLIRMTGRHEIWPRSLEAQINAGDAGDFWGLAGYELTGPAERTRSLEHQQFGKLTNVKKTKAVEKPAGQWNTYEIIAEGDTVTLIINGEQVNRATGCDLDAGRICLTSEGSEIHFRNITLTTTAK